jgi:hypothetical protein
MATHRARLTDDLRLALVFVSLGFADYPVERLSVESLTEFKKTVDAHWAEKVGVFQKARNAWAVQYNATLLKEQALAVAQSKLDAAEARAQRDADAWERLAPEEQQENTAVHEKQSQKTDALLAKLRSAQSAAKDAAVSAESATAKLRGTHDAAYDEMMDARRAEELARALPEVWAGNEWATRWFERQVGIVKAYSPLLAGALSA